MLDRHRQNKECGVAGASDRMTPTVEPQQRRLRCVWSKEASISTIVQLNDLEFNLVRFGEALVTFGGRLGEGPASRQFRGKPTSKPDQGVIGHTEPDGLE